MIDLQLRMIRFHPNQCLTNDRIGGIDGFLRPSGAFYSSRLPLSAMPLKTTGERRGAS
jgi:hypothetical protein